MTTNDLLANATVDEKVRRAHPDYTAVLIVIKGLTGGAPHERTDELLRRAETHAAELLASMSVDDVPEVRAWRDAFASFGVKPRVARSSFESLLRRAESGLPRVDALTDMYNAISVLHHVPIGGEDLDAYRGAPRLVVADGSELFDTRDNGELVNRPPDAGEIVWRDDEGVTCRRWNWRQCIRTHLTESTTNALFIFDGVGSDAHARTSAAAGELIELVTQWWPDAVVASREI